MMELALHDGEGPTSVREIAEQQELPIKYLEQLNSRPSLVTELGPLVLRDRRGKDYGSR